MLDPRTAIRREWGFWWRFMALTVVMWLISLIAAKAIAGFSNSPTFVFWVFGYGMITLAVLVVFVQIIVVGIVTNMLVRVYVRAHHPLLIAAASNAAAIITALSAPSFFILPPFLAGLITLIYSIILRTTLIDLYAGHSAHLCRRCLYDLRGLTADRCPECGENLRYAECPTCHYSLAGITSSRCPECAAWLEREPPSPVPAQASEMDWY
jgi:hypothetical protein